MKRPARKARRATKDPRGEIVDPLTDFLKDEASSGVFLLAATVIALVWANSPASEAYDSLWETTLTIGAGDFALSDDLRHWVNDGLMAVFFFVVGLEIKREMVTGELNSRAAAALPAVAAVGGTVVPALVFVVIVAGGEGASGWAVAMATDIAFVAGVLALLGDRVSSGVKLFLLAVAVVDDIIAITIIAGVYTEGISVAWMLGALAGLAAVAAMRRLGVAHPLAYVPLALAIWIATYESGVHATIAGVALGLMTPARPVGGREVLRELEHRIHPFTGFVIVPLFALANAGVALGGDALADAASSRLTWAIVAGLVIGKLVGIAAATLGGLQAGVGELPEGMRVTQTWGVAALGGIGFTVSLFIAQLAFDTPALQDQAKVGVFAGSLVSGLLGAGILIALSRPPTRPT
ncbi:MAG: Na+/H+ antiporter NhaA [Thermoleophilaceae bacterium]|nr:Na+/H+ antiporter NhaA [Thermoleophilaceae bacterium]